MNFSRYFFAVAVFFIVLPGCSILSARFYSTPENGAVLGDTAPAISSYGYYRFLRAPVPDTFKDSLNGTVVTLRLLNGYERFRIGPPFIPLIPGRSGYGYSDKHMNREDSVSLGSIELVLTLSPGPRCSYRCRPFEFRMQSRSGKMVSQPVSVDSITDSNLILHGSMKNRYVIRFAPGMKVSDKPALFLYSLQLGDSSFHPEGIPFRIGKKSFYGPIVPING